MGKEWNGMERKECTIVFDGVGKERRVGITECEIVLENINEGSSFNEGMDENREAFLVVGITAPPPPRTYSLIFLIFFLCRMKFIIRRWNGRVMEWKGCCHGETGREGSNQNCIVKQVEFVFVVRSGGKSNVR